MKNELKRSIASPLFFLSMTVFFLCLQGFALPNYIHGCLIEPLEYRESALALTLGGIFFGGVLLLLPFCAPMTYATVQVDELRSSMMQWSVLRGGIFRYAINKITVSFLASAVSIGVAFSIHAALWHVLAVPYDPTVYPVHEIGFWDQSYFLEWSTIHHGVPIIINICLGLAFSAGVWSVVALATAVWIPDKLLVVTIPACIYKLWGSALSYYIFGVWLPSPDTLFNDAQTISSVKGALIAYGVLLTISILCYYFGLRRRACHV